MLSAAPGAQPPPFAAVRLAIEFVQAVAWPSIALIAITVFRKPIFAILYGLRQRVDAGASFEFWQIRLGAAPNNLPTPKEGATITADHMALIHSSWRYPRKDAEFGTPMWAFHVVIQAKDEVLDRIESVKYLLDHAYPNPVQIVTERKSRFMLKELANGESTVRCQVKIKGQTEVVPLERYINLTATGPRL